MIDFVIVPLVVVGLVVNGLRLRARIPGSLADLPAQGDDCGYAWITSGRVTLDDATRRDAAAYAGAEGLDLVDVVPADLPATAARDLLRQVDPRAYRADPRAAGRSAGAAVLMAPELLKRAEVTEPGASVPGASVPGASVPGASEAGASEAGASEPADVIELVRRVRPYAGRTGAAIVAGPRLRSGGDDLAKRRARLRAAGVLVPVHLAFDVVPYALTVVALVTGAGGPCRVLTPAVSDLRRDGRPAARAARRRAAAGRA